MGAERASLRARLRAAAIRFADEIAEAIEAEPANDTEAPEVTDLDAADVRRTVMKHLKQSGRL